MIAPTGKATIDQDSVLAALGTVIDPDFRKDIVSLGFVKNLRINDDHVAFDIELTTPACPVKVEFQRVAEAAVRAVAGVRSVNVNMTSRVRKPQNQNPGLAKVKNIIAVASCKGGVGKSTVAANIARELSRRGFATGLLDADIFGPSVPTLFGIHRPEIREGESGLIEPLVVNGMKLMSFGFLVDEGPAILRGPMVSQYIQQLLGQVAWGELEYLIIDMPPGTGDVQLTITQAIRLSGAVIVTTRQSLALVDVERGIQMFEKVKVPMLGIVENMSYFVCDNCDKKHYIFGHGPNGHGNSSHGNGSSGNGGPGKAGLGRPAGDASSSSDPSHDGDGSSLSDKYGLETLVRIPINQDIVGDLDRPAENPFVSELVDNMIRAQGRRSLEDGTIPTVENGVVYKGSPGFRVTWQDGTRGFVRHRELRADCRCASCVDERSGEKLLRDADIPDDLMALEIESLGNYALRISWSDGHNTGIYPWTQIRRFAVAENKM
jgi:ATP-binding protein involved in chromosome partitioning